MRLAVPAKIQDTIYTDCEIELPDVDIITETQRLTKDGSFFSGMRYYCAGIIKSFTTSTGQTIEDKISIKSIIPKLHYKTIEAIALQSVIDQNKEDDGIEGFYPCPRCGVEERAEYKNDDGIITDTRDFISQLKCNYFDIEKDSFNIHVVLTEPIIVTDKRDQENILTVNDFDAEIPTLENCIIAEGKVGIQNQVKLQIAIYVESLKKVNGEEVNNKFRGEWGSYMFGKIKHIKKDLGYLAEQINQYGIDRTVEKTCKKCGKVWRPPVNTSNFFAGAPLTF